MSNYTIDFMDSTGTPPSPKYGAADINNIRKALMTKGVLMETETACKVVAGDMGKVVISPGQAIMADGSRIEILTGGEVLTVIGGGKNYVFFHRDTSLNTISPTISLTAPASGDVALAEILEGDITDVREKSFAKAAFTPPPCLWFEKSLVASGLTVNIWQNIGSLDLPAGYHQLSFFKTPPVGNSADPSAYMFDIKNQKGFGWQGNAAWNNSYYNVQVVDDRPCFISLGNTLTKIYINIQPDLSIWVKPTSTSRLALDEGIMGFAFYGGVA